MVIGLINHGDFVPLIQPLGDSTKTAWDSKLLGRGCQLLALLGWAPGAGGGGGEGARGSPGARGGPGGERGKSEVS